MENVSPRAADGLTPDPAPQRQIGILLFDWVEELDVVRPWEVLSTWTQRHPEDGWNASRRWLLQPMPTPGNNLVI